MHQSHPTQPRARSWDKFRFPTFIQQHAHTFCLNTHVLIQFFLNLPHNLSPAPRVPIPTNSKYQHQRQNHADTAESTISNHFHKHYALTHSTGTHFLLYIVSYCNIITLKRARELPTNRIEKNKN